MTEWKSYVEGPRWAGFKKALWKLAEALDLELVILDHEKGFIRETIYFKLVGESDALKVAQRALLRAVEDYNK